MKIVAFISVIGSLITTCAFASGSPDSEFIYKEKQRVTALLGTGGRVEKIEVPTEDSIILSAPQLAPQPQSFYPVSGTRNPDGTARMICDHIGYEGAKVISYKELDSKVDAVDVMMLTAGMINMPTVYKTQKIVDQIECWHRESDDVQLTPADPEGERVANLLFKIGKFDNIEAPTYDSVTLDLPELRASDEKGYTFYFRISGKQNPQKSVAYICETIGYKTAKIIEMKTSIFNYQVVNASLAEAPTISRSRTYVSKIECSERSSQ